MKHLLRILIAGGMLASAIPAWAAGMMRSHDDMLGPARLLLFAIAVALYFLPAALAWYRDCKALAWIVAVDVLLGWTIFGWFVALGWAAGGRTLIPHAPHPVPNH